MIRFILVRHGETDWNRVERFRGHVDVPLNPTGLKQADALAERIAADWRPAAVYTSPLTRAVQTATAIADRCGLTPQVHADLNDMNFGEWQGLTPEEVSKRWPHAYSTWFQAPQIARIPGGETLDEVSARALPAVDRIGRQHPAQTVVLVSHVDVNRVILLAILGAGHGHFWRLQQEPGALNVFELSDDRTVVLSLNDTCHLRSQSGQNRLGNNP